MNNGLWIVNCVWFSKFIILCISELNCVTELSQLKSRATILKFFIKKEKQTRYIFTHVCTCIYSHSFLQFYRFAHGNWSHFFCFTKENDILYIGREKFKKNKKNSKLDINVVNKSLRTYAKKKLNKIKRKIKKWQFDFAEWEQQNKAV